MHRQGYLLPFGPIVFPSYPKIRAQLQITSIYQPTNAHIMSDKTHLKHFKTF